MAPRARAASHFFALAALLFRVTAQCDDPPSHSLAFLPPSFLSLQNTSAVEKVTAEISAALLVSTSFSRHGGNHRAADRPMGGKLVVPPEQRRVRVVDDMRAHFDAAVDLPFPLDSRLRATAMPPSLLFAARKITQLGALLATAREAVIANIRRWADSLRSVSDVINRLMPPSVRRVSSKVNTAFMAAVVDALGWLDKAIVRRFVHGFPVVGDIPDSCVYRPIAPAASPEASQRIYDDFVRTTPAWNRIHAFKLEAHRHGAPAQRAADAAVAAKTRSEVSKGVVVGPYTSIASLDDAVRAAFPGMPRNVSCRPLDRFGVPQKGSIRAIDNGRGNGANRATRMYETVTTPSFFFPAIAARAVYEAARAAGRPMPAMTVALADLTMAYRTVPTSQPWFTTIAFFNPSSSRREYYYLPGHNFGLAAAVVNFNRYPELVVVAARSMGAVMAEHYYDDFIVPDAAAGGSTGLAVIEELVRAFGCGVRPRNERVQAPELDPLKTARPAAANVVLGVNVSLAKVHLDHTIQFVNSEGRINKILDKFDTAFEHSSLTPGEAAKLRGETYFALSPAVGGVGRAATLPLVTRQYRDDPPYSFALGSELHHTMLFFKALLPDMPPLSVSLTPDGVPPVLIYSDASFFLKKVRRRSSGECDEARYRRLDGGLGVVVFDGADGAVRYALGKPDWRTLMQFWPENRSNYIAQLEVLAAVSAYFTYPDVVAGRRVHHFVDNTVALSALVNGYSGKADLAKMVNAFYLQAAGLRSSIYFDYVPSKANIADLPSRDAIPDMLRELAGLDVRVFESHTLRVPGVGDWSAPLVTWMRRFRRREAEWPV